jgi:Flp pilus assembly pilin Flp
MFCKIPACHRIEKLYAAGSVRLKRQFNNKRGQTLVEYGMIIALISIVAIVVLQAFGFQVQSIYSSINSNIAASMSGS